jgi:hypothetical protein
MILLSNCGSSVNLPNSEVPQSKVNVKLALHFVDQRQLFGCRGGKRPDPVGLLWWLFPDPPDTGCSFNHLYRAQRIATYAGDFPAYRFWMGEKRLSNLCSGYRPLRYCPPSPGLNTGEMPWHSEGCKSREAETGDREGRGSRGGDRKTPTSEHSPAMIDLVGRPVKKGSILILRKNRPVQQIYESNKIDQAVQFKVTWIANWVEEPVITQVKEKVCKPLFLV